jgi:uncharacterized protein YecT (DUF1311 family)
MSDSQIFIMGLSFCLVTTVAIVRRFGTSSLLRPIAVLSICASLAGAAVVQDAPQSGTAESDCQRANTTSAMRACENGRYDAAERELNAAYQNLLRHLDVAQKSKLRAAQRAWLRYRDSNADLQASLAKEGTLAPLLKIASLTEMTKARTLELKKALLS